MGCPCFAEAQPRPERRPLLLAPEPLLSSVRLVTMATLDAESSSDLEANLDGSGLDDDPQAAIEFDVSEEEAKRDDDTESHTLDGELMGADEESSEAELASLVSDDSWEGGCMLHR